MVEVGEGVGELRLMVVEEGGIGDDDEGLPEPENVEDGAGA